MIAALAWLGRHGSGVLALGVFLGLLLPPLASLLKPLMIPGIVIPFLIALIRLDWRTIGAHVRSPGYTMLALLWLLVLCPFIINAVLALLPLDADLQKNLVLLAAASPLMASASLALIIGLDASFAVVLTFSATALMPLTLPPLALFLLGVDIDITIDMLMARLGGLIGGCFLLAWLMRRFLPAGFADRHAAPLDGLAIIGLLVFAIAIMDGVTDLLMKRPDIVLTTTLAVFGLNLGMQALGALVFAWRGLKVALTLGLCSGNRNLGIVLAAIADRASVDLLILVALAQLPIYILPVLQRRFYRRWLRKSPAFDREPAGS